MGVLSAPNSSRKKDINLVNPLIELGQHILGLVATNKNAKSLQKLAQPASRSFSNEIFT